MVPLSYQLEILEDIKKSNTILYLPTGCGKTYIATLLIKHMGECLTKYEYKLFFLMFISIRNINKIFKTIFILKQLSITYIFFP